MDVVPAYVAIGRLVRAHGIKGEVAVFPLTAHVERFEAGRCAFLSSTPGGEDAAPVRIESSRSHAGRFLLKLERVESRTVAEQTVGRYLVIPRVEAEEAREEGEFFLHALVGRSVVTAEGRPLGTVADVLEPAGGAMLEIAGPDGARRLLPFVSEFVREVLDDEIIVTPPPGWEEL